MRTVAVQLYPGAISELQDQVHPDGVPFRWLEALVENTQRLVAERDQASCLVQNVNGLVVTYNKTLSPLEESQMQVAEFSELANQVRKLLPREGEAMTPEEVAALRAVLK